MKTSKISYYWLSLMPAGFEAGLIFKGNSRIFPTAENSNWQNIKIYIACKHTNHIQLSEAGLLARTLRGADPKETQDLWPRLLHEGFHIKSTSIVADAVFSKTLEDTGYLIGGRSNADDSPANGRTIGFHCAPDTGKW